LKRLIKIHSYDYIPTFVAIMIFLFINNIAISSYYIFKSTDIFGVFAKSISTGDKFLISAFVFFLLFSVSLLISLAYSAAYSVLKLFKKNEKILSTVFSYITALLSGFLYIFAVLDIKTFEVTGLHIHSPFAWDNIQKADIQNELHFSFMTILTFFSFIALVFILNIVVLKIVFRVIRIKNEKSELIFLLGVLIFSTGSVLLSSQLNSHISRIKKQDSELLESFPFYEVIYDIADSSKSLKLRYPAIPKKAPVLQKRTNVRIVIKLKCSSFWISAFCMLSHANGLWIWSPVTSNVLISRTAKIYKNPESRAVM